MKPSAVWGARVLPAGTEPSGLSRFPLPNIGIMLYPASKSAWGGSQPSMFGEPGPSIQCVCHSKSNELALPM